MPVAPAPPARPTTSPATAVPPVRHPDFARHARPADLAAVLADPVKSPGARADVSP